MTAPMCGTGDCGRPAQAKGWCRRCYSRMWARGHRPVPTADGTPLPPPTVRRNRPTYVCDWCGLEREQRTGRTATVCRDCQHYETYANAQKEVAA